MLSNKARETRRAKREQTRERLLDAAEALLLAHGVAGVSVEDITTAAGMSRGAFYWSFDSKEAVALELIERRAARQLAELEAVEGDGDVARMSDFDAWIAGAMSSGREWFALEMEVLFLAARTELGNALTEKFAQSLDSFQALLAAHCQALGVEPVMPMHDLARLTLALANGLGLQAYMEPDIDVRGLLVDGVNRLVVGVGATDLTAAEEEAAASRRQPST